MNRGTDEGMKAKKRNVGRCLHIDQVLVILVVFGEVGLDQVLGAGQGFVATAAEERHPQEAQGRGHQRGEGRPHQAAGTAL